MGWPPVRRTVCQAAATISGAGDGGDEVDDVLQAGGAPGEALEVGLERQPFEGRHVGRQLGHDQQGEGAEPGGHRRRREGAGHGADRGEEADEEEGAEVGGDDRRPVGIAPGGQEHRVDERRHEQEHEEADGGQPLPHHQARRADRSGQQDVEVTAAPFLGHEPAGDDRGGDDEHEGEVGEPEPQAGLPGAVGHDEEDRAGEQAGRRRPPRRPRGRPGRPAAPGGRSATNPAAVTSLPRGAPATPGHRGEEGGFEVVPGREPAGAASSPGRRRRRRSSRRRRGRSRCTRRPRRPRRPGRPAARPGCRPAGAPATSTRSRLAAAAAPAGRSRTMRPWSITTTRSQIACASTSRWVENTIDAFFFRSPSSVRRATIWRGSSPSDGSSRRRTSGRCTMAPASATRCRWPLDRRPISRPASLSAPGPLQRLGGRRLALARGARPTARPGRPRTAGRCRRRRAADPRAGSRCRARAAGVDGGVAAVEVDRAGRARQQAGQPAQQRRLARPVGPEQAEDLARRERRGRPRRRRSGARSA